MAKKLAAYGLATNGFATNGVNLGCPQQPGRCKIHYEFAANDHTPCAWRLSKFFNKQQDDIINVMSINRKISGSIRLLQN